MYKLRRFINPTGLILVILLIIPVSAPAAFTTAILVTTIQDELNSDGDCSLREAVQAAATDSKVDSCNSGGSVDEIFLPSGTYTLSVGGSSEDNNLEGDLDVSGDVTIFGNNASTTIIQAGTTPENGIDRVFHVLPNSTLSVRNLTVRYGRNNEGSYPHINGGGIYVSEDGELHVRNSLIKNNIGANGGGIFSHVRSHVEIQNSIISNNDGRTGGGGVWSSGTANLQNSIISANRGAFGAGIQATGPITITNSTISGNIANFMDAGYGGGIQNSDTLVVTNSSISGNEASIEAGGLRNFGTTTIINTTIVNNTAPLAGGLNQLGNELILVNSIIANNTGGNCMGAITSNGYNVDSGYTCSLTQPMDLSGTDPMLGPLANNGGPTLTHALLNGSQAINAGNPDICPPTDQRGASRSGSCDIGAYEFDGIFMGKSGTNITITSDSPDPSGQGQPFTVNMVVAAIPPGSGVPSGSVTVEIAGSFESCASPLTNGIGSCILTFPDPGLRLLIATYSGDPNFDGSDYYEIHANDYLLYLPIIINP